MKTTDSKAYSLKKQINRIPSYAEYSDNKRKVLKFQEGQNISTKKVEDIVT